MARILVDNTSYPSKKVALAEIKEAMLFTDGSGRERMTFAYMMIKAGYKVIDTYREIVV